MLCYKSHLNNDYFKNYFLTNCDVEVDLRTNTVSLLNDRTEDWKVSLVETGTDVMTGGRLRRIRDLIDDTFLMTYGDGVSDINLSALVDFHKSTGGLVTLTEYNTKEDMERFPLLKITKYIILTKNRCQLILE